MFYTGPSRSHDLSKGYELVHGRQGEVTGPASMGGQQAWKCALTGGQWGANGVEVLFPGNKGSFPLYLSSVRRPPHHDLRCPHPPAARAAHTRRWGLTRAATVPSATRRPQPAALTPAASTAGMRRIDPPPRERRDRRRRAWRWAGG